MDIMGRIKFRKGQQRAFFNLVIEKLKVVSLRGILQFGFGVPYSTLRNYYIEARMLPESLFEELLEVSGISRDELKFEVLADNWGKVKGGKISKRKS